MKILRTAHWMWLVLWLAGMTTGWGISGVRAQDQEKEKEQEQSQQEEKTDQEEVPTLILSEPGRSAREPAPSSPQAQSDEERQAFDEITQQTDPDKILELGKKFATDYPTSQLLSIVYTKMVNAYRQKNDAAKAVEYGEKALELDPKNAVALAYTAHTLPQRMTGSGMEQAQKLARSQKLAEQGLVEVHNLVNITQAPEEEFQEQKAILSSMCHSALGMVYLMKNQLEKAQEEYRLAVETVKDPDPADYIRLGSAYQGRRKYDEAVAAYENAAKLAPGGGIEQYARQGIEETKKLQKVLGSEKK